MNIDIRVSRDKAIKCSNFLKHLLVEYQNSRQSPEDDVYFGLSAIAKQLQKAVERFDKGIA